MAEVEGRLVGVKHACSGRGLFGSFAHRFLTKQQMLIDALLHMDALLHRSILYKEVRLIQFQSILFLVKSETVALPIYLCRFLRNCFLVIEQLCTLSGKLSKFLPSE